MTDPELGTELNCAKAIATFAVIGAGLTTFYIIKKQDISLSIFKLLINGMALTFAISTIKLLNNPLNFYDNYDPQSYTSVIYITGAAEENAMMTAYELMILMILTLISYTLKRTRLTNGHVIVGIILLIILWVSGIEYSQNSGTVDADVPPFNSMEHVSSVNAMGHVPPVNSMGHVPPVNSMGHVPPVNVMGHVPAGVC
ncbi:3951_t:CDS:2 [Paraglomus occultum]|uniref:3951_t:CDS:1 n=1 Tax=Paraglomus occultum TaxID=144539 RepID=A0A9N9ACL0_9GLOM|nr:3951_t:CDS:2 [Paraglomus occultum]